MICNSKDDPDFKQTNAKTKIGTSGKTNES